MNREPGADIAERMLQLGIETELAAKQLPTTTRGRHVGLQLVRAATGAGSNYAEARAAESRADFVHKVGVALKELREAHYWLRFVAGTHMAPVDARLIDEARQLIAILAASRKTAASKL